MLCREITFVTISFFRRLLKFRVNLIVLPLLNAIMKTKLPYDPPVLRGSGLNEEIMFVI